MRDDLLQPAFAVYNSPGVYALLLGSGVSRSAEIMTGWEIMRDLIKQIAGALKEEIEGSPEDWYLKHFEKEAGYDLLLEHLGRTPLDRNDLLRDYIEPSEADREEDRKVPMPAHKAIAWLVEKGYVRVILTTNFDRLIETALQEKGIVPNVISTDADIAAMRPLQHSQITIIKIHGDYRDEITKNTKTELANYSPEMKILLQRVFSEYGLIVSGWSAEWDVALKDVIENSKSKFATYWSWFGKQADSTRQLFEVRQAYEIQEIVADELFNELQKMIEALEGTKAEPPLTVSIAIERTKKMLPRPEFHIELEELFVSERERTYQIITGEGIIQQRSEIQRQSLSNYQGLWQLYLDAAKIPLNIATTISFYGGNILSERIHSTLKRWTEQPNGNTIFRFFPSLLLIYSVGISAVFRQNWKYLTFLFADNEMQSLNTGEMGSLLFVVIEEFLELERGSRNYGYSGKYLYDVLRPIFQTNMLSDTEYNNTFDLFETLLAMHYLSLDDSWMPPHLAIFTNRSWDYLKHFWSNGGQVGADWELLTSRLIGNDRASFEAILENYVSIAREFRPVGYRSDFPNYGAIYKGMS